MEPHDAPLDDVRQLVAERQRYAAWLAALELRRQDTPPRVFARVREDYTARHARVQEALQGHLAGLERAAQALAEEVARLEAAAAELDEERIEASLRTQVGELDAVRWEVVQEELEGRLAQLADARSEVATRLADTRELLSRGRGEPVAAPAVEPPPAPVTAPPSSSPPPPAPPPPPARPIPPQLPLAPLADAIGGAGTVSEEEFDRALARLDQVPSAPAQAAPAPREEHPSADDRGAAAGGATGFDELAFVRAIVDNAPPDVRKTLRCGECGAPNLPTEWYCERCGGELAAE